MAATVFGAARYGMVDDSTATGIAGASFTSNAAADEATAKNHIGCDASYAIYNDRTEVEFSGVVATKATGLAINLGSVVTLSNVTADSLNTNSANLFSTPVANAGLIVRSANLTRTNTGFEEGSIGAIFNPLIATNSPTTLT
jgi:hypothetical protein